MEVAAFLLDAGARLDPPNAIIGPLSAAVGNGHVELARMLLERGAKVNGAAFGFVDAAGAGASRRCG